MQLEQRKLEFLKIQAIFADYFKQKFQSNKEEYEANCAVRHQLKELLSVVVNDSSEKGYVALKREIIQFLAENTGCAEDQQISDEILDTLFKQQKITEEDLEIYYRHLATGRWY